MNNLTQRSREGTASFQNGEQVDFHRASEHVDPYLKREANEALDQALATYATDGLGRIEVLLGKNEDPSKIYKEKALAYVRGASRNLVAARQYEQDTNWNLEDDKDERVGGLVRKVASLITGDNEAPLRMPGRKLLKGVSERELLQKESAIGRELFGEMPEGVDREFYNFDPNTWMWYESIALQDGQSRAMTTRYEVQESGILKAQDGAQYSYLEGEELINFVKSTELYYRRVMSEVYQRNADTGEKYPSYAA